jgi:hypothetical protein
MQNHHVHTWVSPGESAWWHNTLALTSEPCIIISVLSPISSAWKFVCVPYQWLATGSVANIQFSLVGSQYHLLWRISSIWILLGRKDFFHFSCQGQKCEFIWQTQWLVVVTVILFLSTLSDYWFDIHGEKRKKNIMEY